MSNTNKPNMSAIPIPFMFISASDNDELYIKVMEGRWHGLATMVEELGDADNEKEFSEALVRFMSFMNCLDLVLADRLDDAQIVAVKAGLMAEDKAMPFMGQGGTA